MASYPYGPKWGQSDKWGKPKCKFRSVANGGIKPSKPKSKNNKEK